MKQYSYELTIVSKCDILSKYFFLLNYFSVIIVFFFFPLKFILVMVQLDKPQNPWLKMFKYCFKERYRIWCWKKYR